MGGQPVLLLHTTGRHSGRARTTPVQYAAHGKSFVVVAADHGARRPPAWYRNLRANPTARVRIGTRTFAVAAREASGDERADLWSKLTAANRYLPKLQIKANRQLPLLLLTPTGDDELSVDAIATALDDTDAIRAGGQALQREHKGRAGVIENADKRIDRR